MESEGEEEDQENTPMLHPRERQEEGPVLNSSDKRKLFRQQTISNPGYQIVMKKFNSSKKYSRDRKEFPELPDRPANSFKSPQTSNPTNFLPPTTTMETYMGVNSLSSGYSTLSDSQPNSRNNTMEYMDQDTP